MTIHTISHSADDIPNDQVIKLNTLISNGEVFNEFSLTKAQMLKLEPELSEGQQIHLVKTKPATFL